jgi:acetyl-CoA acetyltransferase
MRDIAVISFAQTPMRRRVEELNEVEMLMPAVHGALRQVDMTIDDIGFTCSGSTDYLAGMAFSFVSTLDAVGPWPPIQESHVEMDGAWALYEAWVKLQLGEIDTALVYAYAKSSPGDLPMVLTRQLDPITMGPLWPDSISLAALQARALLDSGRASEAEFAEVAARSRRAAMTNPNAQLAWDRPAADVLAEDYLVAPLRRSDCPPITDGAAAIVLAAGDVARSEGGAPGVDPGHRPPHRADPPRAPRPDRERVDSHRRRAGRRRRRAGRRGRDPRAVQPPGADPARAMGLGAETSSINPSGGALAANPMMTAGLVRIGEVGQPDRRR